MLSKKMKSWMLISVLASVLVGVSSFVDDGESANENCLVPVTLSCGSIWTPYGEIPLGDRSFCQYKNTRGNKNSCSETDCLGNTSTVECWAR